MNQVRELEEASLDGLPALSTERYDGWIIRTAVGYSRRSNSVWPLYPSSLPIDDKLLRCEARYAAASQPCTLRPVACARATISGAWLGLFDLAVAPDCRRRGLGRALTIARLAWGHERGVRKAFAQVMAENTAEHALQASLGFTESYRYWYRIQPT